MKDHWGYDNEKKPDIIEVVRCKDCEHLVSVNKNLIYAVCNKTNKVFHAFENYSSDTREFFCAYGERRSE